MTNYLLDTLVLIWLFLDSKKIPKILSTILSNPDNNLFVSASSFWEITIKFGSGKLNLGKNLTPNNLLKECLKNNINKLDLSAETASSFHELTASCHNDPFDRMLIWQALKKIIA